MTDDNQDNCCKESSAVSVFGRRWDVFPRVIVFDVDETLWPFWIDTHTIPPYRRIPSREKRPKKASRKSQVTMNNKNDDCKHQEHIVVDGSGNRLELFEETEMVLTTLQNVQGLKIAYASRTGEPSWMEELAKTIFFAKSGGSMWDLPDYREIYPGSKIRHFRSIARKSGVPCHEMLFFDDEPYNNMEVSTELGVTFVDASGGITRDMVIHGLERYEQNFHDRS